MKSPQQRLIDFCKMKSIAVDTILQKEMDYFTPEDEDDIMLWTDRECNKIIDTIVERITSWNATDGTICPWCIRTSCVWCGYGERHGKCPNPNSDYHYIYKTLAKIDMEDPSIKGALFDIYLEETVLNVLKG